MNASLTAANIGALVPAAGASPITFTFSNGFSGTNSANGNAAINLTGPTTVTFTGTAAAPTFSMTTGGGTLTGSLSFGSCDFKVLAVSPTGLISLPATIVVTPCTLTLNTSGQPSGTATIQAALVLGGATSNAQAMPGVTIGTDGTVSINGVPVGTVTLGSSTGGTG